MEIHLELTSSTIKNLPKLDRPREKALRYGVSKLSDAELLAVLIAKGYKGVSALELATTLICKFNGLHNLSKVTNKELEKIKGLKEAKSLNLTVAFEIHNRLLIKAQEEEEQVATSEYLYNKYKDQLLRSNQENLILIMLNSKGKIIHEKVMYIGTENNIIFSYHDIWRELLNYHAKSFYLIHSHPGNSSEPSYRDKVFTSELFIESNRINIPMVDHLIIGENGYYSFHKLKK